MADKPVIFSAPMVRAIIEGRKTMTRRVLKPLRRMKIDEYVDVGPALGGLGRRLECPIENLRVPYAVGDKLWVRESITRFDKGTCDQWVWYRAGRNFHSPFWADDSWIAEYFPDQGQDDQWKAEEGPAGGKPYSVPSIHMPRWASRLTLTVTGVKVERLQEISEEDCRAEGAITEEWDEWREDARNIGMPPGSRIEDERDVFRNLWNSLHGAGAGAWAANPFVAAISFKAEKRNIDARQP